MKEAKEISIEDHGVDNDKIWIEYYEENDFKAFTCPLSHLEEYVNQHDLLEWSEVVIINNTHVDDIEGKYEFSEYVRERLDAHTVKKFLISELEKIKSA